MNKSSTTSKTRRTQPETLRVLHPHAAGIDVGAREHYVAVPPESATDCVRKFGCLTPELHDMARWMLSCGVTTVALESTGVYWVPVVQVLDHYGLQVCLVDARNVKNVSGRKTDVQDCQWLRELHSYGLLSPALLPETHLHPLRTYWRHRASLVQECSRQIHLMQKALECMNLQLHKVLSDIAGISGMRIIRAILDGQRDPQILAGLCHPSVKNTTSAFVDALTGYYRDEQIFVLGQFMDSYEAIQRQIAQCDIQIHDYLQRLERPAQPGDLADKPDRKKRPPKRRKNQPYFDLRAELFALTGVDLTQIDGIDAMTAFTVVTEQGLDMSRFPTEKHFASHMGLCPNNRITGGRIHKRRTRRVQSRAAKALRVAAQSLHHCQTSLGDFYRRMIARMGPAKAITATAHKLAKIIYRMLKYGQDYNDDALTQAQQRHEQRLLDRLVKHARKAGYDVLIVEPLQEVS